MPASLAAYADAAPAATTLVALGSEAGWQAIFAMADPLREDALAAVTALQHAGITTMLFSGDRPAHVEAVAQATGIADARAALTPEGKRDAIAALQRAGAVVAMVGDGVNDGPALAQAQVSFALASGTPLAQWTADVVVLNDQMVQVATTLARARRAMRILHQNFAWAIAYNLVAIPAAAMGYVSPLVAAVGMAVSSLVVVGNALRLTNVTSSKSFAVKVDHAEPVAEVEWKS